MMVIKEQYINASIYHTAIWRYFALNYIKGHIYHSAIWRYVALLIKCQKNSLILNEMKIKC